MKEILELMESFHQLSIGEMELEYHGIRLSLKKEKAMEEMVQTEDNPGKNKREEREPFGQMQEKKEKPHFLTEENLVTAPLAGTFYRASAPGETPFVLPGQKVKKGEVLGVLEAMKMMNEILASKDGVVEEILVEDETMVEYEQPLIVIK